MVNSEGEAETVVAETDGTNVDAAIGYAHEPIAAAPAAVTKNAVPTLRRSGWIGLRTIFVVVFTIPIVAPLTYVAAHVV